MLYHLSYIGHVPNGGSRTRTFGSLIRSILALHFGCDKGAAVVMDV